MARYEKMDFPVDWQFLKLFYIARHWRQKTPHPSPQRFLSESHRKDWRQFAEIQFARIFSSKMNLRPEEIHQTRPTVTRGCQHLLNVCSKIYRANRISCFQKLLNVIFSHVFYSTFWWRWLPTFFTEGAVLMNPHCYTLYSLLHNTSNNNVMGQLHPSGPLNN